MPKGTCPAEVMSNSKTVALAVIELHLSEGISQLVSQSVSQSLENSVNILFHSNFLKAFRVDLKA